MITLTYEFKLQPTKVEPALSVPELDKAIAIHQIEKEYAKVTEGAPF